MALMCDLFGSESDKAFFEVIFRHHQSRIVLQIHPDLFDKPKVLGSVVALQSCLRSNPAQREKLSELHRGQNHQLSTQVVFAAIPLACQLVKNFVVEAQLLCALGVA